MILTVKRDIFGSDFTLSAWYLDGNFECYGVEDVDRFLEKGGDKIYGETAIPRGTYNVIISFSPRFKRDLPLLISVKGFDGVRIHPGNSAKNTEGCLLPGTTRDESTGAVGMSVLAFKRLFAKMQYAYMNGEDLKVVVE